MSFMHIGGSQTHAKLGQVIFSNCLLRLSRDGESPFNSSTGIGTVKSACRQVLVV